MNKKYIFVYDGAGDRPISSLGNLTPIQYAQMPTLDDLAYEGAQALITVIDDVIAPESDSGCMALLSYDPLKYYTGRGPLEAYGAGMYKEDYSCVAFRVNFASYQNGKLERRTARGLSDFELRTLTEDINQLLKLDDYHGTTFKLISYRNHRGIVCFYNKEIELSGDVSYTDPGFKRNGYFGLNISNYTPIPQECIPLDETDAAMHTAKIINIFVERAHIVLQNHCINLVRESKGQLRANYLLVRDGGDFPEQMPSFTGLYKKRLTIFGQLSAEKAIAQLIGADFVFSRQKEAESDACYFSKLIGQILSVQSEVIFAHLKGPDEPGHDNKPLEKVKALESLDKNFLCPFMRHVDKSDTVVVTCDHATPCELKLHSNDKVPIVVYGAGIKDNTERFGEEWSNGDLPIAFAKELMPFLLL